MKITSEAVKEFTRIDNTKKQVQEHIKGLTCYIQVAASEEFLKTTQSEILYLFDRIDEHEQTLIVSNYENLGQSYIHIGQQI